MPSKILRELDNYLLPEISNIVLFYNLPEPNYKLKDEITRDFRLIKRHLSRNHLDFISGILTHNIYKPKLDSLSHLIIKFRMDYKTSRRTGSKIKEILNTMYKNNLILQNQNFRRRLTNFKKTFFRMKIHSNSCVGLTKRYTRCKNDRHYYNKYCKIHNKNKLECDKFYELLPSRQKTGGYNLIWEF